uniref:Uncharacterized protein n=1 Tax=Cucumis melo TaxID=3656 RepID=A0A9I9EKP8_CUCME
METVIENFIPRLFDSGGKVVVHLRSLFKDEDEGDNIIQNLSLDIFQLVGEPFVENCMAGDSNTEDQGSFEEAFIKHFSFGPREQISFQKFKDKYLEHGLVDHIVVSNKSVAKVFVRSSRNKKSEVVQGSSSGAATMGHEAQCKCFFNIGSIDLFEKKLEEAQKALNIDPRYLLEKLTLRFSDISETPLGHYLGWSGTIFVALGYLVAISGLFGTKFVALTHLATVSDVNSASLSPSFKFPH